MIPSGPLVRPFIIIMIASVAGCTDGGLFTPQLQNFGEENKEEADENVRTRFLFSAVRA